MEEFVQQLLNGVGRGSQYALWTVGYGLVFQVLGLMHFAHGDTLLLGLYIGFSFVVTLALPFGVAAILVVGAAAILAALVERSIYRPLVSRNDTVSAFIAALGAAFILRNIATLVWGRKELGFPSILPSTTFRIGNVVLQSTPLVMLAIALAVVGSFSLFLKMSRHGQAIVAVAQSRRTSSLMGINVSRFITIIYALSGALGMIGAIMFVSQFGVLNSDVGFFITMKAFFAAIVGGLGRIEGAVLGGLLLGVLEALIIGYVSGLFVDAFVFGLLALVLIVRPTGLIGRSELRKV